jgi:hypothetical protein
MAYFKHTLEAVLGVYSYSYSFVCIVCDGVLIFTLLQLSIYRCYFLKHPVSLLQAIRGQLTHMFLCYINCNISGQLTHMYLCYIYCNIRGQLTHMYLCYIYCNITGQLTHMSLLH